MKSVAVAFDVMTEQRNGAAATAVRAPAGEERKLSLDPSTRVIAVASGKGGVGKSSLTANLAAALAQGGAEVGVVDADIYGYSMPRMLGISRRPGAVDQRYPALNYGLKIMSIGFFVDGAHPWRGPMLHRAPSSSCPMSTGAARLPCGGHASRHGRHLDPRDSCRPSPTC
jgi:ATP-binding protein involved in chromosome partitioning